MGTLDAAPSMRVMKMALNVPCTLHVFETVFRPYWCMSCSATSNAYYFLLHIFDPSLKYFLIVCRCLWLLLVIWSWTLSLAVQRRTNGPGSGDTVWHPGLLWLLIKGHRYLACSLMRYCRNIFKWFMEHMKVFHLKRYTEPEVFYANCDRSN